MCEYSNLFNTLHMAFLFVIYICTIKYIKDAIALRAFLLDNKYSVRRQVFLKNSENFYALI